MGKTKIEWTDRVWNPITGCSHISEGCLHCYAKRMANRLKGRYGYPQDNPFEVTFHPDRLEEPLHYKKPSMIFVCSMGDLFHDNTDNEWLKDIFATIRACPYHTFIILTKRPQNINPKYFATFPLSYKHVWLGVSVENQKIADERIPILLSIPAEKRFVSVEPMLEEIDLWEYLQFFIYKSRCNCCKDEHKYLDWVICGGETGPGARTIHPGWVRSLRDQCETAKVPFFFKQWNKKGARQLDDREYNEFPHP